MPDPQDTPADAGAASADEVLAALAALAAPLARLAVAHGLPLAPVEALLREAFVDAASAAHPGLPEHRKASRISTTTGLNRREVTRILRERLEAAPPPAPRRSPANQLFLLWHSESPWLDAEGRPRVLPRLGPTPSFESLAQAVTRDVHPRSLLDELVRLGLVQWDAAADTVAARRDRFVASGDRTRQLDYLTANVGDHLRAATDNVLAGLQGATPPHLEQALLAWGLGAESLRQLEPLIESQWQALRAALVPVLRERVAADATPEGEPPPPGRIRIGLYAYREGAAPAPDLPVAPSAGRTRATSPRRRPRAPAGGRDDDPSQEPR